MTVAVEATRAWASSVASSLRSKVERLATAASAPALACATSRPVVTTLPPMRTLADAVNVAVSAPGVDRLKSAAVRTMSALDVMSEP